MTCKSLRVTAPYNWDSSSILAYVLHFLYTFIIKAYSLLVLILPSHAVSVVCSLHRFTIPFVFQLSMVIWRFKVLVGFFFPGYLSTCVCIYVYKYIYRKQASCVYAVYTQTHTETHVYLRVCIKRMYSTGLKIRPCKTSLETDLPENGLLSTILCEGFCYLVLLSIALVWCLPFASVVVSFLSQNGMPLGISKVYGCLGQQTAAGRQRRQGPNACFASARVLDSPVRCYFQERDPDVLICSCWHPCWLVPLVTSVLGIISWLCRFHGQTWLCVPSPRSSSCSGLSLGRSGLPPFVAYCGLSSSVVAPRKADFLIGKMKRNTYWLWHLMKEVRYEKCSVSCDQHKKSHLGCHISFPHQDLHSKI